MQKEGLSLCSLFDILVLDLFIRNDRTQNDWTSDSPQDPTMEKGIRPLSLFYDVWSHG